MLKRKAKGVLGKLQGVIQLAAQLYGEGENGLIITLHKTFKIQSSSRFHIQFQVSVLNMGRSCQPNLTGQLFLVGLKALFDALASFRR